MQDKLGNKYPLVSIICFCKNCVKTIRRCINSIVAQDYPNIEIIVQDGASTDGTLEILQEYGSRIDLVSEPDLGPGDATFRALGRISGEFFGLCLSDEELLPHAVSWGVENLLRYPEAAAIYGDHYLTDIDGNITGEVKPDEWNFERYLCSAWTPPFCASFFRRSCYEAHGLHENTGGDEFDFWVRLGARFPIRHVPGLVAKYALHPEALGLQAHLYTERFAARKTAIERLCNDPETPEHIRLLRDKAIASLDPALVISYCYIGSWDLAKKHAPDAFKKAGNKEILRSIAERFYNHGAELQRNGELEEALEYFDLLVKCNVAGPNLNYRRANILFKFGGINEAAKASYEELKFQPDHRGAKAIIRLAQSWPEGTVQSHTDELAKELFKTGVKYLSQGDAIEATKHFEEAVEYCAALPDLRFAFATAYVQLGKLDLAKEACLAELKLRPEHSGVKRLLEQIEKALNESIASRQRDEQPTIAINVKNSSKRADTSEKPICLFLNTYYPEFLNGHYRKNPQLISASYQEQVDSLQGAFFGDSDFYSEGLKKAGWEAEDLIINHSPLQQRWALENDFSGEGLEIAVEQIRRKKPEVVYLQDLSVGTADFLSAIRPYTELIVGQIACPVPACADLKGFDIIFSSFPHFVERFRKAGITSYYQPLAFEPTVLKKIPQRSKKYAVTFVGGMSPAHGKGQQILEELSELVPIDYWGYGAESLPENSPIRQRHHGESWGPEMFSCLRQSTMTINRHIDVAENYANNMRLFEATGCGAMLITDYKDNLNELFEIGKEVVAYRSLEEAAALIKYYSIYPEEAEKISHAGRQRTLTDHTYTQRMKQTAEILSRHLRYRQEKNRFTAPDMSKISCGFSSIQKSEICESLTTAWQSEDIPAKQRALVQQELEAMYKGTPPTIYQVLADCIKEYVTTNSSILEIGCSSGYYYEILEYLLNKRIAYTGVDYSEPLISMAKDYYPNAEFFAADGANMPFDDGRFHIAISSSILLHVPNYQEHIAETARVAKDFVVAHRTPICRRRPTQYFKKFAYGVETVELGFNEDEILSEFASNGLRLIKVIEYDSVPKEDKFQVTYLFRKYGK